MHLYFCININIHVHTYLYIYITSTNVYFVLSTGNSEPAVPAVVKGKPLSPRISLPSTILTPLSALTSPIVDIGLSPPTSQLSTPTAESAPPLPTKPPTTDTGANKPKEMLENPIPKKPEPAKPVVLRDPRLSASAQSSPAMPRSPQQQVSSGSQTKPSPSPATTTSGVKPLLAGNEGLSSPQTTTTSQLKPSTTLATVVKQEPVKKGENEGSNKREKELGPSLPKRIRLTRKSAGTSNEQN